MPSRSSEDKKIAALFCAQTVGPVLCVIKACDVVAVGEGEGEEEREGVGASPIFTEYSQVFRDKYCSEYPTEHCADLFAAEAFAVVVDSVRVSLKDITVLLLPPSLPLPSSVGVPGTW